jgi:Fanconi anemia group M protein
MKERFFDIFSGKKEKTYEKPKIIVDYREKNSLLPSELSSLGIDTEFRNLKVADYIIKNVAVERKTVKDFISSVIDKRLFKQLEEIKQYPKFLLIIEGIEEQDLYNDKKEGMNENAVRGVLLSILLKYNVPIMFTKDERDTAKFMNILARKEEKKHKSLNPKKKSMNKEEQKQFILESFPGIGPSSAKKLLKEFGSIKSVINTPVENIKGIIGKKADIFERLLD